MEMNTDEPPENISERIERERKTWMSYSFSEEHLPKKEVKQETQIPTPPPPVQPVNNPTLDAKLPDVKKEKSTTKQVKEGKKVEKGKDESTAPKDVPKDETGFDLG
jgi:hypothetical protein